jgi:N-acetylglutamate synthase-like GNAT family acetyltransferase
MQQAKIRHAVEKDIPVLEQLIEQSVHNLTAGEYTQAERQGALGSAFGVDTRLIRDQTYFVAEIGGEVAGCGGWSKRKTLYGSDHGAGRDDALLDPAIDAAKIRAFFIHPRWARRGLGTQILLSCEAAAKKAGFTRLELGATLSGIQFYKAHGFEPMEESAIPLPNGERLRILRMGKAIGAKTPNKSAKATKARD